MPTRLILLSSALFLLPITGYAKAEPAPVGSIAIRSIPERLPFSLRGPGGMRRGRTPIFLHDMPIGAYTVSVTLPHPCRIRRMIRDLEAGRMVEFVMRTDCPALQAMRGEEEAETVSGEPQPPMSPEPVLRATPPPPAPPAAEEAAEEPVLLPVTGRRPAWDLIVFAVVTITTGAVLLGARTLRKVAMMAREG